MILSLALTLIITGIFCFMSTGNLEDMTSLSNWLGFISVIVGFIMVYIYDYRLNSKLEKIYEKLTKEKDDEDRS